MTNADTNRACCVATSALSIVNLLLCFVFFRSLHFWFSFYRVVRWPIGQRHPYRIHESRNTPLNTYHHLFLLIACAVQEAKYKKLRMMFSWVETALYCDETLLLPLKNPDIECLLNTTRSFQHTTSRRRRLVRDRDRHRNNCIQALQQLSQLRSTDRALETATLITSRSTVHLLQQLSQLDRPRTCYGNSPNSITPPSPIQSGRTIARVSSGSDIRFK